MFLQLLLCVFSLLIEDENNKHAREAMEHFVRTRQFCEGVSLLTLRSGEKHSSFAFRLGFNASFPFALGSIFLKAGVSFGFGVEMRTYCPKL